MEGSVERRGSLFIPILTDSDHSHSSQEHMRSPSPEEAKSLSPKHPKDGVKKETSPAVRHKAGPDSQYADTEIEELFAMLRESESLEEQGDILQYLVDSKGLDYNTGWC